ncbi:MAG TPA: ABC transporter permease [Gemmatimonadales bacterium]|nr:ABC transporter permease [Gemmatimonadales bacterium]
MRRVWAIVRREFVERVRRKWFWISALLGPVFFALVFLLPVALASSGGSKRIAVVDGTTSDFGARVAATLDSGSVFAAVRVASGPRVVDSLVAEVGARRLDGILLLTDSVVATGAAEYRASNISSLRDVAELEGTLTSLVAQVRLERAGVDPRLLREARGLHLRTAKIAGSTMTGESSAQSFSLAYLMGLILYTVILVYGVNVKSSVLEEKTTRIVEVLLSSVRPFSLLAGKILGVGAVSLLQLAIWGVAGRALANWGAGLDGSGPLAIPHVSAATAAIFLAYFIGGFLLYSAMFAAVGALSSTEQEAQQAQQPIALVLVGSVLSMFALLNEPNSTLAVTLSLLPFSSPIAMPVRWAAGDLPPLELVASLALLVAGIVVVTWVASRIYRVGILMTGKRPTIRELVRWVKAV